MDAISLWQPWASLIAIEAKRYETREWPPPKRLIGQRIAIHAAKHIDRDVVGFVHELMSGRYGEAIVAKLEEHDINVMRGKFGPYRLPVGCVVCTAVLDAAFQLGEPAEGTAFPAASIERTLASRSFPPCFTVRIDDFGNYAPGRWAWLLRDVEVVKPPVPAIGRQGIFTLPEDWRAAA